MSGVRYFAYSDDAAAREKELEIVNSLGERHTVPSLLSVLMKS